MDTLTLPERARAQASPTYLERAWRESAQIEKVWLDNIASGSWRVMDIGCGLAAVDAYLARRLPLREIYLLDGDAVGKKDVYTDGAAAWNDVTIGVDVVRANVAAKTQVLPVPMNAACFPQVEMVISLRSWCHHYPAGVYLDRVRAGLIQWGTLICDVRTGTGNFDELVNAGFSPIAEIERSPKRTRIAWKKL